MVNFIRYIVTSVIFLGFVFFLWCIWGFVVGDHGNGAKNNQGGAIDGREVCKIVVNREIFSVQRLVKTSELE